MCFAHRFILTQINLIFHVKSFARELVLKQRLKATRTEMPHCLNASVHALSISKGKILCKSRIIVRSLRLEKLDSFQGFLCAKWCLLFTCVQLQLLSNAPLWCLHPERQVSPPVYESTVPVEPKKINRKEINLVVNKCSVVTLQSGFILNTCGF